MKQQKIILISHGQFDDYCLEMLAENIEPEFGLPVKILQSHTDLSLYYDPARRQYDANELLKYMNGIKIPHAVKMLGLFRVDLFIPILTYIFGQAYYNGNAAVVSMYRLRNEQYGLPPNEELLIERLQKVAIHELGHAFGLIHCQDPECVMRASTYVEDIDLKNSSFCNSCKRTMGLIK